MLARSTEYRHQLLQIGISIHLVLEVYEFVISTAEASVYLPLPARTGRKLNNPVP